MTYQFRFFTRPKPVHGAVLLSIALQHGVPLDVIRGATTRIPPDLAAVPERGGDHGHKRMLRLRKSHLA